MPSFAKTLHSRTEKCSFQLQVFYHNVSFIVTSYGLTFFQPPNPGSVCAASYLRENKRDGNLLTMLSVKQ